jgi:hypothetical protein
MIPARNVTDVHLQEFVAYDEMLLIIVKAVAHYTVLEMLDIFGVCAAV